MVGVAPTVWFALIKASNSAWSSAGRGGGPGLLKDDRGGAVRGTELLSARMGMNLDDEATRRRLPIMAAV